MAIPAPHHPCWRKLVSGALEKLKTEHLGTQLLIKRMFRSSDPDTAKASELHTYFTKWERILPGEVAQLTTL